jgi:hypothetical protein
VEEINWMDLAKKEEVLHLAKEETEHPAYNAKKEV